MSGSNRGQFIKNRGGLTASIIAAAFLIILVAWPAYLHQRDLSNNATRNAEHYAENAKNNITVKCIGLTGQSRTDCSSKIENAARENQRDEYDLKAQEIMALWTGVMGGMAVIGVSLSGVGVYLIWQTWGETKLAASTSQKTYTAFVDLERPRLVIEVGHELVNGFRKLDLIVTATNIGKSLAYIEKIDVGWRDDKAYFEQKKHRQHTIGICLKSGESEIIWDSSKSSEDLGTNSFFGGTVFYRSPFSPEHKTYFIDQYVMISIGDDPLVINMGDPRAKWPADT